MRYFLVVMCLCAPNLSYAAGDADPSYISLNDAGFSEGVLKSLDHIRGLDGLDLNTLQELQILTRRSLLRLPNLGPDGIHEIQKRLEREHLQLGALDFLGLRAKTRLKIFRLGVRSSAELARRAKDLLTELDLDQAERETFEQLRELSEPTEVGTSTVAPPPSQDPLDQPFTQSEAFAPDVVAGVTVYLRDQGVPSLTLREMSLIDSSNLNAANVLTKVQYRQLTDGLSAAGVATNLIGMGRFLLRTRVNVFRLGVRKRADFASYTGAIWDLDLTVAERDHFESLRNHEFSAVVNPEQKDHVAKALRQIQDAYNSLFALDFLDRHGHLNVHRESLAQLQAEVRRLMDCASRLDP